jgi:Fe-S oxidoreductase
MEMERSGKRSFCCGGGGGHMWMEEKIGEKINVMRLEEALSLMGNGECGMRNEKNPQSAIVSACPFCLSMFEDAKGFKNAEQSINTLDIAELVVESIDKVVD